MLNNDQEKTKSKVNEKYGYYEDHLSRCQTNKDRPRQYIWRKNKVNSVKCWE